MPVFSYRAINEEGESVQGTVSAQDRPGAAAKLRQRGFTVTRIDEDVYGGRRRRPGSIGTLLAGLGWVRTKDIVLFFRMCSSLVASNITISEAIEILHEQAENRRMKAILYDIKTRIEGGEPLSEAMSAYPRVFPDVITNMISAGELGGILDTVLERISEYLESKAALRSKIIISMIYPSIIVIVATVVVVFLVTFVIPKFATLLGGRQLPANTQFLLDVADFLTRNSATIAFTVLGGVALGIFLLVIPETRLYVDRYKIRIPLVGPIFRYGVIAQFSKTCASLLASGITLIDALKATAATVSNLAARRDIGLMNAKVFAGEPLSSAFAGDSFFTPIVRAMVKIGEHSGLMDQAMDTAGELHEKLLQDKIARMSALVEPALILVLGGIVGYVAWGLVAGMLALYAG
jgi:type IV pilus assembly protein PilC